MLTKYNKNLGFTLVELSIVIVIIGFLIVGVIAGTNLIKQATLRSVISDMTGYVTSYNNFLSRYDKVPGDMDTAYAFWGAKCAATPANCNGNANGLIDVSNRENVKAWNHLSNAGMIANTNIQPAGTTMYLGINAPASKIAGAGYTMLGGNALPFSSSTNALFLTKPTGSPPTIMTTAVLTPSDAFLVDQKVDDAAFDASGRAIGGATGDWRSYEGVPATIGMCVVTATGAYVITNKAILCNLGLALNS